MCDLCISKHRTVAYTYVWDYATTCAPWLIRMCDVIDSYVRQNAFICATCAITNSVLLHTYEWETTQWHVCCDSYICVTWLIHVDDLREHRVKRYMHAYVKLFIHVCAVTHSYVWCDSFICVAWLIHMCDLRNHTLRNDACTACCIWSVISSISNLNRWYLVLLVSFATFRWKKTNQIEIGD